MSTLEQQLATLQAGLAAAQQLALETVGEINPAYTAAQNDVIYFQQNIALVQAQMNPGSVPSRTQGIVNQTQLANNPGTLINGVPTPTGIPANSKLINNSYYLAPDGTIIPIPNT